MDKLLKNIVVAVSLLAILCGFLFFFQLGKLALTDPDETFYAETAKEMLARGEWVTPYIYGHPQFEKPILFYWLVESSFKIFGVNEFAARLPSALFGMIGVIAIFFLGRILFNSRAGFLSAIILATNVEYVVLSRACITDMVLFVFLLLAVTFFFYGYMRNRGHYYLLSASAMAMAVLTKGPIFLILFILAILVFLLIAKDLKALKRIPVWQSALVFIVLALPWYLAMYRIHGQAFIDGFFGFHNVNRFLVSEHKIGSQVYYNIPIVLGGMFPWSLFIPVAFWQLFKKIRLGDKGAIFLMVWFIAIFGFFTASSTKLPTYIFPCFLAVALIVGVLLDEFLRGLAATAVANGVRASYYTLAVIMLFGWVGAAIYAKLDLPSILPGVVVSALCLAFGTMLSLTAFINKRPAWAFAFVAYSVAVFMIPLSAMVLPEVERYETSKEVSTGLLALMKPGEKLAAESNYVPGIAFYTGKFPLNLDKHHIQISFINSKERVWAVMKNKNHGHLYNPEITKQYVRPSYIVSSVGKRSIITNELPEGGRFLIKRERPE